MNVALYVIGKDKYQFVEQGVILYQKRLISYCKFEIKRLVLPKKYSTLPVEKLKQKEANLVISRLPDSYHLILLDEKGKTFDSNKFAAQIENYSIRGIKNLIFIIGGAFGFHQDLYLRASDNLSLSKMTYSHQLIRLVFLEQLYRAYTIINNQKYHNQ